LTRSGAAEAAPLQNNFASLSKQLHFTKADGAAQDEDEEGVD
jgi:hypothetical protein